jgi:hypothetical protein
MIMCRHLRFVVTLLRSAPRRLERALVRAADRAPADTKASPSSHWSPLGGPPPAGIVWLWLVAFAGDDPQTALNSCRCPDGDGLPHARP